MAGRRQHDIPRFLQKGFASRTDGKKAFVWMHRRGHEGIEVETSNVGLETDFYGKSGPATLDEQITQLETDYSNLVADLRTRPHGYRVEEPSVPNLIAHLCVRTRFLRHAFKDAALQTIDHVYHSLQDEEILRGLVLHHPAFQKHANRFRTLGAAPEEVEGLMLKLLENNRAKIAAALERFTHEARASATDGVRDAHNRSLSEDPSATERAGSYARLGWFIVEAKEPLLLGDSVCVFETAGGRRFKPLDDKGDDIRRILLPISSDRLLVGTASGACPELDFHLVTKAVIRCSYEYFISPCKLPAESSLVKSIGEWSALIGSNELSIALDELVKEKTEPSLRGPTTP
jgi:hypothetical protein